MMVSFAGLLMVVVLLAIVAAVLYFVCTFDIHAVAGLLLGCVFFLVLLGVFYLRSANQRQAAEVRAVQAIEAELQAAQAIEVEPAKAAASQVSKQLTNEQMWEHLTGPKIPLDGEVKTKSKVVDDEPTPKEQPRPDWVDKAPKRIGNVYREVIKSGPYSQVAECHRELENRLREVTMQRLGQIADLRYAPSLEQLGLGVDFVLREVCREEWVETVEASVGDMRRVHVLMEFDAAADEQLRTGYRNYERSFRVSQVGGVAGLSLGGLALLYGLLKMDTWTRGYYTKRLFLGVPAVIIGIVLLLIA